MSISPTYKKIIKLASNPNLFFYDLFKKRLDRQNSINITKNKLTSKDTKTPAIDLAALEAVGIVSYLKNELRSHSGVIDGHDTTSLLITCAQVEETLRLIDGIRKIYPMKASVYTSDGKIRAAATVEAFGLAENLAKIISSASDFVVEIYSTALDSCTIIRFFVADVSEDGLLMVRSNNVLSKKVKPATFSALKDKYATHPPSIDIVYTWVNNKDKNWQKKWASTFPGVNYEADRYTNNDELRYSLRSIYKYAPWVNKVYIVSNCTPPDWLSIEHPSLTWVDHVDIFPDAQSLPTFNSHAIESCLHRIKGLSEHFIYLNDDFFLTTPCRPGNFFDSYYRPKIFFELSANACPDDNGLADYIYASNNSSELIYGLFQHRPLHQHKHVPYPLRRSILTELESKFPDTFERTRNAKIRSKTDINVASFLFQHYADATGRASISEVTSFIAKPNNIYKLLNNNSTKYQFICINDGGESATNQAYKKQALALFQERFSEKAPWEVI
ncbi:stealth conserved region 3 domain-containing protein [Pseudomonas sp. NPDC089408]|uniref:stealth conserved region 3 domain-containing protein n=1 Tax=Pseudomonas sp. NPDC089408 TaxID=3364465 RepID=UPI00380ECAF1